MLGALAALFLSVVLLHNRDAHAWSECGHYIIAEIAFDLLDETEQTMLLASAITPASTAASAAHSAFANRVAAAGSWPSRT